jgi:hypothetical protein
LVAWSVVADLVESLCRAKSQLNGYVVVLASTPGLRALGRPD